MTLKPQLEREYQQKKMLAYMDELKTKADIKVTLPETKPAEAPKQTQNLLTQHLLLQSLKKRNNLM